MKKIPLAKPYFNGDEIKEIQKCFRSGWVAGQGPQTQKFAENISKYLGEEHIVLVNSCTSALHLGLLACGVGKGDEVLVANFSYPATSIAIRLCGATPVFVDVDKDTYNMNLFKLVKKITKKSKAILPVHTFGQCLDMQELLRIAKKHKLFVVEDAACALGAKHCGKFAGTFGDVGCFSLHGRKNISTGEGGIVVTKTKKMKDKIERLSCLDKPKFELDAYNYKMSDVEASIGIAQLKKLNKIIKKKRNIAKIYDNFFDLNWMEFMFIEKPFRDYYAFHAFQSYICVAKNKKVRDTLMKELRKKGIETQIGTYTLSNLPVSKTLFDTCIALPLYYEMTQKEIKYVMTCIRKIGKKHKWS